MAHVSRASKAANSEMLAELIPPRILPRVLGRWDLIVVYVSIIFGSYASGQMANAGWQAIGIWLLAYVLFLIPAGMCSLEMGNLFPEEGGVYVWANKTMGKLAGFFGGWLSWLPVFGAIATWTAIITSFFTTAFGLKLELWQQVGMQVILVWISVGMALFSLRTAQNVVNKLFYPFMALSVLCFLVGVGYAITHGSATPLPTSLGDFVPDLNQNGAVFALAVLLLLGVETPFNMGVEIKSVRRSAPWMVFGGSLMLGVLYLMTTIGIMLTTKAGDADPYVALAKTYGSAGLPWLVGITAFIYTFTNLGQIILYQYAYARLLFISGVEKHFPKIFAYVDPRTRTPVAAILLQGAVLTLIVLVMYSNSNLTNATQVLLAALTVLWCLSNYFFIFPVAIARRKYAAAYSEPGRVAWKIPGGTFGVWLTVVTATLGNTIAIYYCFAAPWVADMSVAQWFPQVATVTIVAILAGLILYFMSLKRRESVDVEDELAQYATLDRIED
jgi:amino acid transporter